MAATPEVKATPMTFSLGASGSVFVAPDFKKMDFSLSAEDKKELNATKVQLKSRVYAPLQHEYDEALAEFDPMAMVNKRFAARKKAIDAALRNIDAFVDDATAAGRPLHEIQAMAAQMASMFVSINNQTAEVAAPARLTRKAYNAAGATAPGGQVGKKKRKGGK
jgi:hypothetical protein